MAAEINAVEGSREYLEAMLGQVWDTEQLRDDFDVLAFQASVVVVGRKAEGKIGSLFLQHSPRYFWDFEPHTD